MSFFMVFLGTVLLAGLATVLFFPKDTLRLLRRKNYQYEVTFGLYMLTPTEKVVLNSFLLITISMIVLATFFYFPTHVATISRRVFYYYNGYFMSSASNPISTVAGGVATLNNAIQSSLSQYLPFKVFSASQQAMTGAQGLVKGLTAAAAAEVAQTLHGAAATAEDVASDRAAEAQASRAKADARPPVVAGKS